MKLNKRILLIAVAAVVIIIAFLLRARPFIFQDFFFLPDQARDLLLVREMVQEMKPPLIGARVMSGGLFFHGPMWIWLLGVPFLLFGGNPQYIFYFYLFISMLIVFLVFGVSTYLYGWKVGIFTTLLTAISSILVLNITGMTNAHIMPAVFVLYLGALILYLRGRKWAFYAAIFLAGLGLQFEGIFSIALLPYTLLVSLLTDRYVLNIKRILLTSVIFIISVSTFLLFDLRHEFLMTKAVMRMFFDPTALEPIRGFEQYANIFYRMGDRAQALSKVLNTVTYHSSSLINILLIANIIGAGWLYFKDLGKTKKELREFLVLIFLPVFVYCIFIIFPYPIWGHYVYSVPIVVALVIGISMGKLLSTKWGMVVVGVTLFLLVSPLIQVIRSSYETNRQYAAQSDGFYANQLSVAEYILRDAKGSDFGYFVYSSQIFTYGMDYLLWWKGKELGGAPQAQKKKIFYLVMYPPLKGDDNAHAFWKKNVLHTHSQPIVRKVFPGNIVVEKMNASGNEPPVDQNYYLNVR